MFLRALCGWAGWLLLPVVAGAQGESLEEVRRLYATGRYYECLEQASHGVVENPEDEEWHLLRIRSQLRVGLYDRARETVRNSLVDLDTSIRLMFLAHEIVLRCGEPGVALEIRAEIQAKERAYWRYRDAENMVIRGYARLLGNADAKDIMDSLLLPAKKQSPELLAPRIAIAELALAKHDYGLAARELTEALELYPDEPELHYLMARAAASTDGTLATRSLARALELNPNHAGALLLAADHLIASESYAEAGERLRRVVEVDANLWEAWAYRAVLAHLEGDFEEEQRCREKALARWAENPGVDHLIGRELSEKYRFAEAAACQRRALAFDDTYKRARFQLAQDLLRLGEEEEGWALAEQALDEDEYNVVAFNQMVLHDVLAGYRTLERDGFLVRMDEREARVYGERVLDLLVDARDVLATKYEVELRAPIIVEIFAEQKDFAIRTFGLPGGAGFLGVCFGDVVTMQSPATPGKAPTSWEATLYHEFCHVVTLAKTNNRMPRWLSEGISVYEERLCQTSWGQDMMPAYRQRILAGAATPLSRLSSAFLQPDGPLGLQFAYFESACAVEYILDQHGLEALLAVLDELGRGITINASLARHVASLEVLDDGFDAYLRQRAQAFAPDATWGPVEASGQDPEALLEWVRDNPEHIEGLQACARALIEAGRGAEAIPLLERVHELCPDDPDTDPLLAHVFQQRGDEDRELQVRTRWAARDADSLLARERLLELLESRADWEALHDVADGTIAIQPMSPHAHRRLARAAFELDRPATVIRSATALLELDPVDPAQVHFQLARASADLGDVEFARRQVLQALEEAPRYREAHALLLELAGNEGSR